MLSTKKAPQTSIYSVEDFKPCGIPAGLLQMHGGQDGRFDAEQSISACSAASLHMLDKPTRCCWKNTMHQP